MSMFPSFKLPQLLRKSLPESEIFEDVPRLKCSELPVKQRIGQGSFRDVNTSEYKGSEDINCQTVVFKSLVKRRRSKVQIFISQSTDFHFAKNRFSFRKVQIFISQSTDIISFRFVSQSTISQSTISLIKHCLEGFANLLNRNKT